ncbi:hypothetical protein [Methylocystis sp. ATCC 49242]|uniref:hypothetical protein n=1 Tax=Methylocystis sp. ATCC 49242 TaxID=622637 RepID=UPI0001F87111|nr:hypothetical protein [Methylocystis sp. ATCC 49242]
MAFEKISREPRRAALVTELRYAVVKTPNDLTGRLKMPVELVKVLGWQADTCLDIAVGTDEDAGWFALTPTDAKHRAKLKIQPNGVGVYASSALKPAGTTEKVNTYHPEARIDEETQTLYVKLAA